MLSRREWDNLSDQEKFEHLYRQSEQAERSHAMLTTAIARLHEEIRQLSDKMTPTTEGQNAP